MDAIVFDWDGTLVDSLPAIFDANLRVLEEYGLPFDDDRYRAAYVPDWRLMYQRLGVPDDALDAAGAALARAVPASRRRRRCCRGVAESLQRLVDAGFVHGPRHRRRSRRRRAASSSGSGSASSSRCASSAATTIATKPHPDPLLRVARPARTGRDRIATARYVGDVPDDMRMARAVGRARDRDRVVDRDARRPARRRRERGLPGRRRVRRRRSWRHARRRRPSGLSGLTMAPPRARSSSPTARSPPRRRSTRPGPAGTTASRSSSPPTAARATPAALGLRDRSLGRRRRLDRRRRARRRSPRRASRSTASPADKDESDTELALLAAVDAGARRA